MITEWVRFGKPSLIGTVTGTIAGLATITPASGFVGPFGALVIGAAAGLICFVAVQVVKQKLKIDDSLDVFAVHGVGGMMGTMLVAILVLPALGGMGLAEGMTVGKALGVQLLGIVATVVWAGGVSWVLVKVCLALVGLRVDREDEIEGLDITSHGERGYEI
jgi:Amt family ammonium transporter